MDEKRNKNGEVILYALNSCGISDLTSTIMVGDREYDILGAKEAGLDSIGVLYGYGDYAELKSVGATCIAESIGDILRIITRNER